MLLLLGRYIVIDKESQRINLELSPGDFSNEENHYVWICNNFSWKYFAKKISAANLNIKAIYSNPTQKELSKIEQLLRLPESLCKKSYFKVTTEPEKSSGSKCSKKDFDYVQEGVNGYRLRHLLGKHMTDNFGGWNIQSMHPHMEKHVALMEENFMALETALNAPSKNLFDDPKSKLFLQNNFPIALLCKINNNVRLLSFRTGEYRAKRILKFGDDITAIATDTREHAAMLKNWLDSHGFSRLQVMLIADLAECAQSCEQPKIRYQHPDGFARLSFLAANKVDHTSQPSNLLERTKENLAAIRADKTIAARGGRIRFSLIKQHVQAIMRMEDGKNDIADAKAFSQSHL